MSKKTDPATETIEAIREGLPPGVELDEREEALLDLAARQARDVAAAEADIAERGYLITGSRGQNMINPSVSEARQSRTALGKLLGQLDLPESTRDAVRNARTAAETRWKRAS
jgi:uncharacterized protein with von Willebrand factor type A (vWA) domain